MLARLQWVSAFLYIPLYCSLFQHGRAIMLYYPKCIKSQSGPVPGQSLQQPQPGIVHSRSVDHPSDPAGKGNLYVWIYCHLQQQIWSLFSFRTVKAMVAMGNSGTCLETDVCVHMIVKSSWSCSLRETSSNLLQPDTNLPWTLLLEYSAFLMHPSLFVHKRTDLQSQTWTQNIECVHMCLHIYVEY